MLIQRSVFLYCIDRNECSEDTHHCSREGAICTNTIGSHYCRCQNGYRGDGFICQGTHHTCLQNFLPTTNACIISYHEYKYVHHILPTHEYNYMHITYICIHMHASYLTYTWIQIRASYLTYTLIQLHAYYLHMHTYACIVSYLHMDVNTCVCIVPTYSNKYMQINYTYIHSKTFIYIVSTRAYNYMYLLCTYTCIYMQAST